MSAEEMALDTAYSGAAVSSGGGGGVVMTHGWTRGPPFQDEVSVDESKVFGKLAERDNARAAKDFDLADDIMHELTQIGVSLCFSWVN
jgi:cysteinyl-tRNA synthetase